MSDEKAWKPRPLAEIAEERKANPDYERGRQDTLDWFAVAIAELELNGAPFFDSEVCGFCGIFEQDAPAHHPICLYQRAVDRISRGGGPPDQELTTWDLITAPSGVRQE